MARFASFTFRSFLAAEFPSRRATGHPRFVSSSLTTDAALLPTLATAASTSLADLPSRLRHWRTATLSEVSTQFRESRFRLKAIMDGPSYGLPTKSPDAHCVPVGKRKSCSAKFCPQLSSV